MQSTAAAFESATYSTHEACKARAQCWPPPRNTLRTHASRQVERPHKLKICHGDLDKMCGRRMRLRWQPGRLQRTPIAKGVTKPAMRSSASCWLQTSALLKPSTAPSPRVPTSAPNRSQVADPCGYRPSAAKWCLANLLYPAEESDTVLLRHTSHQTRAQRSSR